MAENSTTTDTGDMFDCPICLEKLKVPKYLPCLHTFCESCIQSYIESTMTHSDEHLSVNCPVCRKNVTCADKNVDMKNWAKYLPLNHLVYSLMDTDKEGGRVASKLCSGCERIHESVPASFWCQQCAEAFCETCKSFHARIKYLVNHVILPLRDIKVLETQLPDIEEPCPYHRGKVFEVYCLDHRKLCCSVCFATQHRACSDVKSLEEVCHNRGTISTDVMIGQIANVDEVVDLALVAKRENIVAIDLEENAVSEQMLKTVQDIKDKLDNLYEQFKEQTQSEREERRSTLLSSEEHLKCFKRTVVNALKLLKAVSSKGSDKQMFITAESLRLQVTDHLNQIKSILKNDKKIHVKFSENEHIKTFLEIKTLGSIDVEMSDTRYCGDLETAVAKMKESFGLEDIGIPDSTDPMFYDDPFDWTVERLLVINCNSRIRGGTFLVDGKLVLVDYKKNKIKVYDQSGHLLTGYSLSRPYDATRSDSFDDFFVTSQQTDGTISISKLKLGIDNTISLLTTYVGPSGATGIYYARNMLVMGSKSTVYTVDITNGNTLHNTSGGNVGGTVGYVTASCKSDRLVHVDRNTVVCRTKKMKEVFRYKGSLVNPRGLALDMQNNVYVCDHESNFIYQIKKDGTEGRKLPVTLLNIKQPYNIQFHLDGKTFFVSDIIKPYVELYMLKRK